MSRKSKGINAERELIHLFWKQGWACIRVAGSGASRYPTPDLVAGNKSRFLAIECKSCRGNYQYLGEGDIQQLRTFAERFGAEPWIGVRFSHSAWMFFGIENLDKTENNYVITRNSKGSSFELLIEHPALPCP